ncbi:MAG: hypothetical protein RIT27_1631 [Pseudomonadota bacterium]|jgi:hypothetical protein
MAKKTILNTFLRRGGDTQHPHAWVREQISNEFLLDAQTITTPQSSQMQLIEQMSAELVQSIFTELRATRFDFSVPNEHFDIDELELQMVQLIQEWAETETDSVIASEIVFLDLFLRRLVAEFSANNRFWELLLLKLDRALVEHQHSLGHILNNDIEILMAAVPRFPFVRSVIKDSWQMYQRLNTDVPIWLPIILILNARPDATIWQVLLRSLNQYQLWENLQQIDLSVIHKEVAQFLRNHWERAQLDWFEEACETLDNWLYGVNAYNELHLLTENNRQRLAQSLSENTKTAIDDFKQWLEVLLYEATLVASMTPNSGQTRDIWRYRLAHLPDQPIFWKKTKELSAFLQRLEIDVANPRLNALLNQIHNFAPILEEVSLARQEHFSHVNPPSHDILIFVLKHLTSYRIFFNPHQAIAELKARTIKLFDGLVDSTTLHNIFQTACLEIQQSTTPQNLKESFKVFCEQLPLITAAKNLSLLYEDITQDALKQVRTDCPNYVEEVGENGMQLCARDNSFTLQRAALILGSATLETKETLRWWWDTSVGIYLVHRERSALAANLVGLLKGLQQKLPQPDAQCISTLLKNLYQEALGVSTDYRGRENLYFETLPLHNTTAQSIFNVSIETPPFFKAFSLTIDEEMAWTNLIPKFEETLRTTPLVDVEKTWQLSLEEPFWQNVADRAPVYLRQIALGIKLTENVEVLAERIATHLTRILKLPETHENKCQRDLGLLINYLAECLRTQPPTLAALNITRYWIQTISPFVRYKSAVWRLTWGRLEDEALAFLSPLEQRALHLWCAQLLAATEFFPLTHEFGAQVFHHDEPLFAEDWTAERQWRDLMGGLLAAATTADCAPITGDALAQRLALATPLLTQTSAADWQRQQTAFLSAFKHLLDPSLLQKLIQRQATITTLLSKIPLCQSLQSLDSFGILLSHIDYAADRWRQFSFLMTDDLNAQLPASLNHWQTSRFLNLYAIVEQGFLQKLVCREYLSAAEVRALLFENIENLPTLPDLVRSISRQFGETHPLTARCQLAAQQLPMVTASIKLLNPQEKWSAFITQKLNLAACEDLTFLMRRIGLHLSGLVPCRDFARWFWRSTGQYLSLPTRQHAEKWLPQIPKVLSPLFSVAELQTISIVFNELSGLFSQRDWQSAPTLRDFLLENQSIASTEKSTPIIQHLELEGNLWSKVFIQRSPPLFYTSLENALPHLLQGLTPDLRNATGAFLHALYRHGDEEAAWQAMQSVLPALLIKTSTDQILTSWRHFILRTSQQLPTAQSACWILILWRGFEVIRQTALGLKMQQHADNIAENMLLDFPALTNQAQPDGLTDTAKCRRDLRLFIEFSGKMLSQQPFSLAALNTGRFLVQYVAPFVHYSTESWRLIKLRLQEKTLAYLDKSEHFALYRWIGQLNGVFEQLSFLRGDSGLKLFYKNQESKDWHNLLGGVLASAMTSNTAPLSGSALLQRLMLSSPALNETESLQNQWQSVFEVLNGEIAEKVLETHARLQTYLSKLPILQQEQGLRGFDVFCAVFANYPYTRELWHYEIWSRVQEGWLTAAQPADRVVAQLTGWRSPSLEKFSRLNEHLQQITTIPTTWKTERRQWFNFNEQTIQLTQPQQQIVGFILKLLILRSTFETHIETFKLDVSEIVNWGLEPEMLFQALYYQSQTQSCLEKRGQLLLEQWISSQAGLKLLQNPQSLGKEAAVSFKIPQCERDLGHLLRQIGLQLTGLQQTTLENWFFDHIGGFLQRNTRQTIEKQLPVLLFSLKKYFTDNEWQHIESQLKSCYNIFNHLEWTETTFSNWILP